MSAAAMGVKLISGGVAVASIVIAVSVVSVHLSRATDARDEVVIPFPPSPPAHPTPPSPPPSPPPPSPPPDARRLFQEPSPGFAFNLKASEIAHLKSTVLR